MAEHGELHETAINRLLDSSVFAQGQTEIASDLIRRIVQAHVRAVNNHERLIKALEELIEESETGETDDHIAIKDARAALKQATED